MIRYILGRLASIALTFTVVSVIVFLMMHAVPGGPFDGNDMPVNDAVKAKLNASLGLDQPLYVQYFKYMWGVLHFDFGVPFQSPGETVLDLLARAWPPSLILGGAGVLIGAPLGILLGMAAALRRNTWIDYLASAFATLGPDDPGVRDLDGADHGVRGLAELAARQRLGQAERVDPADHRLCRDPDGDLCALHPQRHAGCSEQTLRHRAARQGAIRAPHHLPTRPAQCRLADGHGVPADVHRHRHRLDLCRGDVPRAGPWRLFRQLDRAARL